MKKSVESRVRSAEAAQMTAAPIHNAARLILFLSPLFKARGLKQRFSQASQRLLEDFSSLVNTKLTARTIRETVSRVRPAKRLHHPSLPARLEFVSMFVVFMMQQVQTLDGEKSAQLSSKLSFPEL